MSAEATNKAAEMLAGVLDRDGSGIVTQWTRLLQQAMTELFMAMAPAVWAERVTDTMQVLRGELLQPDSLRYPVLGPHSGSDALRALAERSVEVHLEQALDLHEFESAYFLLEQAITMALEASALGEYQATARTLVDHFFKQLAVAMAKAVTSRRVAVLQREVDKRQDHLEHLRRQDETLATFVTDELRRSLNAILDAQAHFREARGKPTPDEARHVSQVNAHTRQALGFLGEALDFTRLDAGSLAIVHDPLEVRQLVHQALSAQAEAIARKGLRVVTELPADLPAVPGDPLRLQRALRTLVAHVVLDAPARSHLWVRARAEGPSVLLEIEDERPRPPDEGAALLERFERPPDDEAFQLGLPMVRLVLELHGGELRLAPDRPRSCYQVFLPRLPRRSDRLAPARR